MTSEPETSGHMYASSGVHAHLADKELPPRVENAEMMMILEVNYLGHDPSNQAKERSGLCAILG